MVSLAGPLGELLAPELLTGYVEDVAADDQERAIAAAAELTAEQAGWLDDAEHAKTPGDDDHAFETARRIAGDDAAAAFVHFLNSETRRLMFSPLVRSLVPPVVDELLRYEVIPGESVRHIMESLTGESLRHEESVTMVRAAAKRVDPNIPHMSGDTPVSRLMICARGIIQSRAGGCLQDAIVLDTDPRVAEVPEAFRPLIERLDA
jgi:hypothetical protein